VARPAPAATRALAVLDLLAANPEESFTLSTIAKRLGMSMATAHAVLHAMVEAGYLVRHPEHRTFSLGPAVVAIGNAALDRHPLIALAREEMQRLAAQVDAECMASLVVGDEVVVVGRAGRPHPHRPLVRVGDRRPLVPPLGIAWLAWSTPAEIERWLARLGDALTPAARTQHEHALAGMRALGFTAGVEHGEDSHPRTGVIPVTGEPPRLQLAPRGRHPVAYVAAPVFDAQGGVALVLNLDGFLRDLTATETTELGHQLRDAGLVLTRMTGGRPPYETTPDARRARP